MDLTKLKTKLGLLDGDGFASLSSAEDLPYQLTIDGGDRPHFKFQSESLDVTYHTDNDAEMLVAIRDTISEFNSQSRILVDSDEKIQRWMSGAVELVGTRLGKETYRITRRNKMVSSETELVNMRGRYQILRKVGLYEPSDMRLSRPQDALYVFLANFESARLDKMDVKESMLWTIKLMSGYEGKQLKLPQKLDGRKSGMLARKVTAYQDGEELDGILLNIKLGTEADVLIDGRGVVSLPKTDIWI